MGVSKTTISPENLIESVGTAAFPTVIDVRRAEVFEKAADIIPTAQWRDHRQAAAWGTEIAGEPGGSQDPVIVYCVHGHQVSLSAVTLLRTDGIDARALEGGIEAYRAAGGPLIRKSALAASSGHGPSRWITRERPKIDRIACPWLIRRFIDRQATFHFVASDWVRQAGEEIGAIPFDIPDTEFSHVGELCSFDAFLTHFGLSDPALRHLAGIVRGADTARLDLAPQSAGLLAMSLGLAALHDDDLAMLEQGMIVYDALYAWCRYAAGETHDWQPDRMKAARS
jgi:rhodanese-related sulfurtransferase